MSLCFRCLKENLRGEGHYGLHSGCFSAWYACNPEEEIRDLTPRESESHGVPKRAQSFLHGKFRKYTATMGGAAYVLKLIEKDYPHLPRVEYVCNQIAEVVGLPIPAFSFLTLEGQDCFVSRNFVDGTQWKKLTHIYHYIKPREEFDVETIGNAIFGVTGKPQDVNQFHTTLLFDALVGNHDRHGRNLGILSRGRTNRLAPTYDNPSYIGIESLLEADLNPLGKIYTQDSQEPTMKDYVLELKRLGREETLLEFKRACSLEKILTKLETDFLPPKVQSAMIRLIRKRYEEFHAHI